MGAEQFNEAAGQYRKLTSEDTSDAKAWYGLALAYQKTGNIQRSHEVMDAYQRIQKQNREQKAALATDTQIAPPAPN
jgi:hypothetical protein